VRILAQKTTIGTKSESHSASIGTPEIRALRASLRVLEREISRCLEDQTECCGVTLAQCHVLLELASLGSVSLKILSESLELDKSTLSRAVDSLVGLELVTRRDDPENRRQQMIALSNTGKAKVTDINQRCDAYYRQLFGRVPEVRRANVMEAVTILADAMVAERKSPETATCCTINNTNPSSGTRSKTVSNKR
jgi:DNA-binding MarR family transcriptional regulator